jgi:hypothetical protein
MNQGVLVGEGVGVESGVSETAGEDDGAGIPLDVSVRDEVAVCVAVLVKVGV